MFDYCAAANRLASHARLQMDQGHVAVELECMSMVISIVQDVLSCIKILPLLFISLPELPHVVTVDPVSFLADCRAIVLTPEKIRLGLALPHVCPLLASLQEAMLGAGRLPIGALRVAMRRRYRGPA
jgi:hypothetical protein